MLCLIRTLSKGVQQVCSCNNGGMGLVVIQERLYASKANSKSKSVGTIRPQAIRDTNSQRVRGGVIDLEHGDVDIRKLKEEFRREIRKEFKTKGDIPEVEADLLEADVRFDEMMRNHERLRLKFRRHKLFRKHYKQYFGEREVSILTYAEKEKIRHLHESSPEEWTPEALATAFPVSVQGVEKLLKSSFRAKSVKEIQEHDKNVEERIERIKGGEIEMTPDLAEKMKVRDKVPFKLGEMDSYNKELLLKMEPVKFVGEFQRLVAPSKNVREADKMLALTTGRAEEGISIIPEQPDHGDFYDMEHTDKTDTELRHLKITGKRMTFEDFKKKMKLVSKSSNAEINYVSSLDKKSEPIPTTLLDYEGEAEELKGKIVDVRHVKKYVESEPDEASKATPSPNVPHHREADPDRIFIPSQERREGVLYRRGNSYYDENGEFLYKVI